MNVACKDNLEALSRHLSAATDAAEAAYQSEAAAFSALDPAEKNSDIGNGHSDRALFLDVLREDIADSRDSVAKMLTP